MKNLKISFNSNSNSKMLVLSMFGKTVDNEGFIIEADSRRRVLTTDGNEITLKEFGAIKSGSEIFVKEDIASLVDFFHTYLASNDSE